MNCGKSVKVVTSRAVKKGEELCDNYGSSWGGGGGGQVLKERRKALAADFGFKCTCLACAAEEKEEKAERFEDFAKRNLTQKQQLDKRVQGKEVEHADGEQEHEQEHEHVEADGESKKSLNDLWTEHKRNQEFAWKSGNLRLENLRK